MNILVSSIIFMITLVSMTSGSRINLHNIDEHIRIERGIRDWPIFARSTTTVATTTTIPPKKPNNLLIGECEEDDKVINFEKT